MWLLVGALSASSGQPMGSSQPWQYFPGDALVPAHTKQACERSRHSQNRTSKHLRVVPPASSRTCSGQIVRAHLVKTSVKRFRPSLSDLILKPIRRPGRPRYKRSIQSKTAASDWMSSVSTEALACTKPAAPQGAERQQPPPPLSPFRVYKHPRPLPTATLPVKSHNNPDRLPLP
jgi:hypothetical protein